MQVNMHEAKSQLSALAEKVWQGETVVITKAGIPYLDLLPHQGRAAQRKPGRYKNQITMSEDFDQTPQELIDAFEGNG